MKDRVLYYFGLVLWCVTDTRSHHRLSVHAGKLFYCDVCEPHEKGGKGFEEFEDVVRHVCNENGISLEETFDTEINYANSYLHWDLSLFFNGLQFFSFLSVNLTANIHKRAILSVEDAWSNS